MSAEQPTVDPDFGPESCHAVLESGCRVCLRRYLLDGRMKRALESGDLGDLADIDEPAKVARVISAWWVEQVPPPADPARPPREPRTFSLPMTHIGFAFLSGVSMSYLNEVRRYFRTPEVEAFLRATYLELVEFRKQFVRQ